MQIPINKQRVDAFNEVMAKHSNIAILDSQPADWSTQKALSVMENFLQKHPKIDAVWCQDDDMLKGVVSYINNSKFNKKTRQQFKNRTNHYDIIRNENFEETFPELKGLI